MVCVEDGVCSVVLGFFCKSDPPLLSLDNFPKKYNKKKALNTHAFFPVNLYFSISLFEIYWKLNIEVIEVIEHIIIDFLFFK